MFVQFQATDLFVDAGQMTVPYFDAQVIATSPPAWVTGVRVYHRGGYGTGGFLALEASLYNATRHFQGENDTIISDIR